MITDEERQYYVWIGQSFTGSGEAIELGSWLGCSTNYILDGLLASQQLQGRQLHVYDDFVWRSEWMNNYYERRDRPDNGSDFQFLFDRYTGHRAEHLDVHKCSILPVAENAAHARMLWSGAPIELLYVDCGRTYDVNQAWWDVFAPCFLPNKTLIMMQDWQLFKEDPPQWYNQTKEFTDSKGNALSLVHELLYGAIGTFVYRG
jgi:hypothetical protein